MKTKLTTVEWVKSCLNKIHNEAKLAPMLEHLKAADIKEQVNLLYFMLHRANPKLLKKSVRHRAGVIEDIELGIREFNFNNLMHTKYKAWLDGDTDSIKIDPADWEKA